MPSAFNAITLCAISPRIPPALLIIMAPVVAARSRISIEVQRRATRVRLYSYVMAYASAYDARGKRKIPQEQQVAGGASHDEIRENQSNLRVQVAVSYHTAPVDEAATDQLFSDRRKDNIAQLASSLISEGLASRIRFIYYEGKVIGKTIIRNYHQIRSMSRRDWDDILCNWEPSWHGTKSKYIKSILSNGLMPSGARLPNGETIAPPQNHYQLGQSYFGVSNWAAAIFVSPSLLYASHACFSERFFSENIQWCIVVKTQVRRRSYTHHDPTTLFKQARIDGEPHNSEYRVPCSSDKDKILRVEQSRNVVVISVVFIQTSFLEKITSSNELRYDQLQRLFE